MEQTEKRMKKSVLVVDDEKGMIEWLKIALEKEGYEVETAMSGEKALELSRSRYFHCVITDIKMAGMDGLQLLKKLKEEDPDVITIIITAYGTFESAVEALRSGASDFITKPFRIDEITFRLKNVFEKERLRQENIFLKNKITEEEGVIIGESKEMKELLTLVDKVAITDATIMIYGETGTGKELIARRLHNKSYRKSEQFVALNCGALPDTLLESELFGYKRGAFTGAVQNKKGLFKVADGGTFFLDEVGEISPKIQVKLLRVLQYKEVVPLGDTKTVKVNVRLVGATNKNLEESVRRGEFREDLFYRLNVIPVFIPPLRDRKVDIPLLIKRFTERTAKRLKIAIKEFSPAAMDKLMDYTWPGNVRELENCVERTMILLDSDKITEKDISLIIHSDISAREERTLKDLEINAIRDVIKRCGGNKVKAAKMLGIHPSTLYRKMKRLFPD
ncbi:sigma-54-dependent Fis family transcriptional regulator [candidate division WOR-3 bacterium]|nr:sigma-54-dependent Fis family transcriptional regulator [candidate division WOR-3 bacterium]TET77264.1 MAG: sigma-54-dependent Fis family transcriptional regulator [Candidatus Cloacimonadota bacterium]